MLDLGSKTGLSLHVLKWSQNGVIFRVHFRGQIRGLNMTPISGPPVQVLVQRRVPYLTPSAGGPTEGLMRDSTPTRHTRKGTPFGRLWASTGPE